MQYETCNQYKKKLKVRNTNLGSYNYISYYLVNLVAVSFKCIDIE